MKEKRRQKGKNESREEYQNRTRRKKQRNVGEEMKNGVRNEWIEEDVKKENKE